MRMRHGYLALCGVLALLTVGVYQRALTLDFINYDDHRYVTENPHVAQGLTWSNVAWAFSAFEFANWHPLTWLSHMAAAQVFGVEHAAGHHLINILLHLLNVMLVFALLHLMTGELVPSALVAALFAVHPLHVESVAWISARKDVLSTLLGLCALWSYVKYVGCQPSDVGHGPDAIAGGQRSAVSGQKRTERPVPIAGRTIWYGTLILFYALSLLAKPTLVTLPALLLLLDHWPLVRLGSSIANRSEWALGQAGVPPLRQFFLRLVDKLPLVAIAIASCVVTVIAQRSGGAIRDFESFTLGQRVANAVVSYVAYLWQAIWPVKLAMFYPHPGWWSATEIWASAALLAAISAIVVALRRKRPYLVVGWLWYLGSLLPVIGLVQVGAQSHADRYTYVPLLGVYVMIAWSVPGFMRPARVQWIFGAAVVIIALASLAWRQIGFWRDDETLARHALAVTQRNGVAHLMLGNVLMNQGDVEGAIEHFRAATQFQHDWPDAYNNLGNAFAMSDSDDQAIVAFQRAIALQPKFAEAYRNLGVVLQRRNELDRARHAFERATEIDPNSHHAFINLGDVLRELGDLDGALRQFEHAVALRPQDPMALINLGDVQARLGQGGKAQATLRRAADAAVRRGDDALRDRAIELLQPLISGEPSVPHQR
jgi:tetratricopeptide (TPR) repeat protein